MDSRWEPPFSVQDSPGISAFLESTHYTPGSNGLFPGLLSALHHPEHSQVAVSLQVVVPDP